MSEQSRPLVAILMGSESDLPQVKPAMERVPVRDSVLGLGST